MTDEIVWEEPPQAKSGRAEAGKYVSLLAPLRDRPGQWAKLPGFYGLGITTRINKGLVSGIVAGDYQATARPVSGSKPTQYAVWVRFIGEPVAKVRAVS